MLEESEGSVVESAVAHHKACHGGSASPRRLDSLKRPVAMDKSPEVLSQQRLLKRSVEDKQHDVALCGELRSDASQRAFVAGPPKVESKRPSAVKGAEPRGPSSRC